LANYRKRDAAIAPRSTEEWFAGDNGAGAEPIDQYIIVTIRGAGRPLGSLGGKIFLERPWDAALSLSKNASVLVFPNSVFHFPFCLFCPVIVGVSLCQQLIGVYCFLVIL
jgi:hypothetical protein